MRRITVDVLKEESQFLRLMVYGAPGSGKTWFGASACLRPETSPWLFLSYRSQIQSLASSLTYREAIEDGRLVVVELDKYEQINMWYNWLRLRRPGYNAKCDELFMRTKEGKVHWPKGVTIDSVTELQRTEVMRRAGASDTEVQADVPAPKIQDWGKILHQFTLFGRLMFDSPKTFPYHVVMCALEMSVYDDKDEQGKDKLNLSTKDISPSGYKVAMQGQSQDLVPAYALTLMRLTRAPRNVNAHARGLTYEPNAHTKDQSGRFPRRIDGPTIPKMVAMLHD